MTGDFAFGGRLALDLTWTLRYRSVAPTDLLTSPDALEEWLQRAVLHARPSCDEQLLDQARVLREAVYRAALATTTGERPGSHDVHILNGWAAEPAPFPQLGANGALVMLTDAGRAGRAGLAAVARDAVELCTLRDGRLRRCEGPLCSLLFHDASRPGTRRWCSTDRCGNKVNTRAYRDRHRAP